MALSGAFTSSSSGNNLVGYATADAATDAEHVSFRATAAKRTTTIAGSVTADDITGSDSSLGIAGAPGSSSAGGIVAVVGGIGNGSGNAGGATSVTAGAGATNAAGGVSSVVGGAGAGNGAGGVAKAVGGVGGTTGAGGAAQLTGGAGGSTSGTGGAATIAGGAATGTTAVGGAASLTGGASAGASGTAGAASVDAGAANSGTAACVNIADVNALATYINRGPKIVPIVGMAISSIGTSQSSTPTIAQLLTGIVTQTGATGAGTVTLPTGTAISAGMPRTPVTGDTFDCMFVNVGGGQTLTITGQAGSTVSGTVAVPSAKFATMRFINTGTNTWNVYCIVSA